MDAGPHPCHQANNIPVIKLTACYMYLTNDAAHGSEKVGVQLRILDAKLQSASPLVTVRGGLC